MKYSLGLVCQRCDPHRDSEREQSPRPGGRTIVILGRLVHRGDASGGSLVESTPAGPGELLAAAMEVGRPLEVRSGQVYYSAKNLGP